MKGVSRRTIHLYPGELGDLLRAAMSSRDEGSALISAFEDAFARHLGVRHTIAVGSGRLGLQLILTQKGIGRGHNVILPAYTDQSVPQAIRKAGAEPTYVDVDPLTHNMDPAALEKALLPTTKAVIATHLFGAPCDMDAIQAFCDRHGLALIEDCAHAVDAESRGRICGTLGDAAIFSFVVTKAINTFGGGMVATNDEMLAYELREQMSQLPRPDMDGLLRRIITGYLMNTATQPELFGRFGIPMLESLNGNSSDAISMYNEHLRPGTVNATTATGFSPLQAAAGLQQMRDLEQMQARRRSIAEQIREALPTHMVPQLLASGDRHAWYFVVATTNNPDEVVQRLLEQGVDVGRYLMRNCAAIDEPALAATYKGAEYLYHHSIQLPAYPTLCDAGLAQLLAALRGLA